MRKQVSIDKYVWSINMVTPRPATTPRATIISKLHEHMPSKDWLCIAGESECTVPGTDITYTYDWLHFAFLPEDIDACEEYVFKCVEESRLDESAPVL